MRKNKYNYKYSMLLFIMIIGCAPTIKEIKTYTVDTGRTDTKSGTKFLSSFIESPSFSLRDATVTFTLYKKELTQQKGAEKKDMKVLENRYKFMPLLSRAIYEKQTYLLFYGVFLALDLWMGRFAFTAGWLGLDVLFTSGGVITGGYPGDQWERQEKVYTPYWSWDNSSERTGPLKNYTVEISIPEASSFTKSYTTDSKGNISVDLKQILTDHPLDEIMSIAVECKFKDPGGNVKVGKYFVSEQDVRTINAKME